MATELVGNHGLSAQWPAYLVFEDSGATAQIPDQPLEGTCAVEVTKERNPAVLGLALVMLNSQHCIEKSILMDIFYFYVVDGVWSQWSEWTNCSQICIPGGTRERGRNCSEPQHGGRNCTGDNHGVQNCNTFQPCSGAYENELEQSPPNFEHESFYLYVSNVRERSLENLN